MKITWLSSNGLDLRPVWEVSKVRLHTVKNMLQPDHTRRDTVVLACILTVEEYNKLVDYFGKESIPVGMLCDIIIPVVPNTTLWTWRAPKGFESLGEHEYSAFEITD